MKTLFIAPIPPPIHGQSKASQVVLDAFVKAGHNVKVVNTSKESLKSGFSSMSRFFDVAAILLQVWKNRSNNDLVYLSLSESFLGNVKDILTYLILIRSLNKIVLHMLGGAGMEKILSTAGVRQKINYSLVKKVAGVIVEGAVGCHTFSRVLPASKIRIVPNFADESLFASDQEVASKFRDMDVLSVLYLSNLISGKGYLELADAYIQLDDAYKKRVRILFVGGFESQASRSDFFNKISDVDGLSYLGPFIDGEEKRALYCKSHVFCLPTYYPFEGQPISILEAYATGCVVITTDHSGIPFVFSDVRNGVLVDKRSSASIKGAIEYISDHKERLSDIAFNNRNEALEKYRTSIFQAAILKVVDDWIR